MKTVKYHGADYEVIDEIATSFTIWITAVRRGFGDTQILQITSSNGFQVRYEEIMLDDDVLWKIQKSTAATADLVTA